MGIIPALAGNTIPRFRLPRALRDHPRSRGEYGLAAYVVVTGVGSSPLSRGIRSCEPSRLLFRGIIPALAGNTVGCR